MSHNHIEIKITQANDIYETYPPRPHISKSGNSHTPRQVEWKAEAPCILCIPAGFFEDHDGALTVGMQVGQHFGPGNILSDLTATELSYSVLAPGSTCPGDLGTGGSGLIIIDP